MRTRTLCVVVTVGCFSVWLMLLQPLDPASTMLAAAPAPPQAPAVSQQLKVRAGLPELHTPNYQLPRPPAVVSATYEFAADHPEVLNYVPCFCGCEESGHKSATQCFVTSRAKNGKVTEWNEHGMGCAMCLAVAGKAMQMHQAHASIKEIRADVEKTYGNITGLRTPTPPPPAK